MKTSRIRDGKKSDPGSGINIPDPQHWLLHYCTSLNGLVEKGTVPVQISCEKKFLTKCVEDECNMYGKW
jgi:hypothetical protein